MFYVTLLQYCLIHINILRIMKKSTLTLLSGLFYLCIEMDVESPVSNVWEKTTLQVKKQRFIMDIIKTWKDHRDSGCPVVQHHFLSFIWLSYSAAKQVFYLDYQTSSLLSFIWKLFCSETSEFLFENPEQQKEQLSGEIIALVY